MKYSGFMPNDFINGQGVCVSLWTCGCPIHCPGCHNQSYWNHGDGYEIPRDEVIEKVIHAISANGIQRNFSLLGGEPLAPYNKADVAAIIKAVREAYPDIIIYCWTGYIYENLKAQNDPDINYILDNINVLIDGPFIQEQRNITLALRGSTNQRVLKLKESD